MLTKPKRLALSEFRVNNEGRIMRRYTPNRTAFWDALILGAAITIVATVFLTLKAK